MNGALSCKTAAITGATGAIATASAKLLARDGAHVALMARRQEGLEQAAAEIRAAVPDAALTLIMADCSDETDVKSALEQAHAVAGRLDVIFSTMGGGGFKPFMMIEPQNLRDEFEANVVSAFIAIRHGAPLMKSGGSIILTSSTSAHMPFPYLGGYHVAKAAVEGLMRAAAEELGAAGIRVNAIRPGMTRSHGTGPMFDDSRMLEPFLAEYPLGRLGEADDIAGAVRFLAGPESGWMTGQSFAIDGGNELRKNPDLTPMVEAIFGVDAVEAARAAKPL
ncbi:SDR family NAD(P)-dependent oxidoreductase [Sphingobium estronivorans]|uniref:SDR family NAD(P)-dependent oxidoreductase n=1 Tax=Sphingobium estronivorans TaxID=1577690 RepID=UPI001239CCC3|nr:SDR family oxidoreductase [Sphingobium estronivorans]